MFFSNYIKILKFFIHNNYLYDTISFNALKKFFLKKKKIKYKIHLFYNYILLFFFFTYSIFKYLFYY